jgi:ferritin-like metal-binding protein YciE
MSLNSLQDLMVHNLKDLYNAERQILGALPRMAKAAQTPALKEALEDHRKQTETHLSRLEEVFGLLDLPARGKACKAMEGLIAEGKEMLEEDGDGAVKDAGIIAEAQKVEHYEISAYGTAATYADLLGQEEVAKLLSATLNEERETDKKLSTLAEEDINTRAIAVGTGGEEEMEEEEEDTGSSRRRR